MTRVYTLYRVSTVGQVDHDDIPMQRIACHEFAQQQGDWEIVNELYEKGVSGYKVSTDKRDAISQLMVDALAGKFDVLLVFMFDRLGRRDDETPFVVQWFVAHGIRVWSVKEVSSVLTIMWTSCSTIFASGRHPVKARKPPSVFGKSRRR